MKKRNQIIAELLKLRKIIDKSEKLSVKQSEAMKTFCVLSWVVDMSPIAPSKYDAIIDKQAKKIKNKTYDKSWVKDLTRKK